MNEIVAKACRTYLISILLALYAITFSLPAEAAHHKRHHRHRHYLVHSHHPYSPTFAGLVIEADTGKVLYQNNADQQLHPASLTKIMTLLMVFEAIDRGQIQLTDSITVSRRAASMAPSKLGIKPGSTITIKDAIYAMVTKSCNDIAVALAEALAGDESTFAARMTARAHQLGMMQTTFADASGLPNANQWSSARDMAFLARYVIATHPVYYRFYSTKNFYYKGQLLHNHNRLMNTYPGMDGMKSGYVEASGFNLVASAVRDNHRLIGVVFGGKTANSRNAQMAALLDASFATLRTH